MNATAPAPAPRSALRSNADFMRLWAAAAISSAGSQVTAFALPITAILVLKANGFEVGLLMTATYAPLTVLGLVAGAWVDRVRRRPLLVASDLVRGTVIGSIPLAYSAHVLSMAHLYVVALVAGTLTVLFDVAHGSYLPEIVDRDSLVAANARLQVTEQGASVLGPAAGALLVTAVGAPLALVVDAVSFLGSAAVLLTIRHREDHRMLLDEDRRGILKEIAAGLRYVASRPSLRAFAMSSSLANLFLRMISTVLILHLIRTVGLSPNAVGVVLSVGEAGFLAGAISVGVVKKRLSVPNTLTLAAAVIACSAWPIALAPSTAAVAIALTSAGLFIYGFAAVAWTINSGAYRQATTPPELLGRTGSVMRVAAWGPIPVSALIAGSLASATSTRVVLMVAAAGAMTAIAPVGIWRFRGARD